MAGHQYYKEYVGFDYFGAVILYLKVDTSNSTTFIAKNLFPSLHWDSKASRRSKIQDGSHNHLNIAMFHVLLYLYVLYLKYYGLGLR